ncbi:MAG TPA: 4-alpha-glucanotransferase [Prolixibacteraceae bacterium]|nr:4-alpha-glucanotransferase [Prolixibacteraceae bacterium]
MERSSGVLLHISSLPGDGGVGSFGKDAFQFVDFLAQTKQKIWQILPLGPVGYGNSPYQCYSAFAGNPLFIDIPQLVSERLISKKSVTDQQFKAKKVEFERVGEWKTTLFREAFSEFQKNFKRYQDEYHTFMRHNSWWLDDYALFRSLKTKYGESVWNTWKKKLILRDKYIIKEAFSELHDDIDFHRFLQFLFFRQWFKLKEYANSKGIRIIGDIPLYVSFDSVDVWANQDIFLLDKDSKPTQVGGVPPDYFSETGQLWGNPVFDWERVAERDFDWWLARMHFNLRMFDQVRVDHFRGLESYWSIAAEAKTAVIGEWLPAKGYDLFRKLKEQLGTLEVIAEDLGVITPEVEKLRDDFSLPGMKILQFAYGSDSSDGNLPHNYTSNFLVYTGTHDNDTALGWFNSIDKKERKFLHKYITGSGKQFVQNFMEQAWSSAAFIAIVPMQDVLGLNTEARMNTPGVASGNWTWRFTWSQIRSNHKVFLKRITEKYNR